MQIGDLIDSQIMQLYPFDFARELYTNFIGDTLGGDTVETEATPTPTPAPTPSQAAPMPEASAQQAAPMQMQQPDPNMMQMQQPYMMPAQNVNVQPAQFQPFNAGVSPLMQQENIDLIMDVPLEVTVELGRSNKSIKEILDFAPGTIIELNKLAGEPVDVLVNGKFVAKGEVVVIEENFGIRIVEISK